MTTTWLDLATKAKPGDLVTFNCDLPQGAGADIPQGTVARVIENGLNEMAATLIVQVDGDDGEIWLPGPPNPDHPGWQAEAPVDAC